MPSKLLIINSIGLTGAEILTADLARHREIRMLPGQNFIGFQGCLYRTRNYADLSVENIFESLATEYFMTRGRIWSGLAKNMSAEQRNSYDQVAHRSKFIELARDKSKSELDFSEDFVRAYFESRGIDCAYSSWLGVFGQNYVLSHGRELLARTGTKIISFENRVEYWLANISQRMTWDCTMAARFWIINTLLLRQFANNSGEVLSVDLESYVASRPEQQVKICRFLGIQNEKWEGDVQAGFIKFDPSLIVGIQHDADLIEKIYGHTAAIKMAQTIDEWAPRFLENASNVALLEHYRDYWNSTSHTNFDWIGPIENELFERACLLTGATDESNLSLMFYHRYHRLNSIEHANPVCVEPQILGILEEEIVLPHLPFFLKIAIEHLVTQAQIAERQAHSYRPLRQGALYRRLNVPECRIRIEQLGLLPNLDALEQQIDRTEAHLTKESKWRLGSGK